MKAEKSGGISAAFLFWETFPPPRGIIFSNDFLPIGKEIQIFRAFPAFLRIFLNENFAGRIFCLDPLPHQRLKRKRPANNEK